MDEERIRAQIESHQSRNAALKRLLSEKGVDLKEPRPIECHFYAKSRADADGLADDLVSRGFQILRKQRSAATGSGERWNVEAQILQSVDLTTRREFIDEMVRLAGAHNSEHDGWGTSV